MSLKADAILLKADAVSLRAEALGLQVGTQAPSARGMERFSGLLSPFKGALTILGTLIAIGMVVQVLFLLFVNRQAGQVVSEQSKADEKVMLQEYYQEHGVRAGSKLEVDMLEEARRRDEKANRERQEQERKYEKFVEDSRREGERVAQDLHRAEQQARYEEERQQRRLVEEKRRQEEEDQLRHEREMARWRR
jgi:flagellar biosynthesis GTPase FlhF